MHLVADILRRDRGAVRAPFVIILGAGVEARVDGHRPVEAADRLALLEIEQELQRSFEDADLMGQRHRSVPFEEVHADIEIERPVRLGRDHACVHPEIAVTLVNDAEIALRLARDEFERFHREGGCVTEGEGLVDAERTVDPVPAVAVLGEREVLGVGGGLRLHEQFQRVPLGRHHVRQRLIAQWIFLEHECAVAHLRHIVFIDVDRIVVGMACGACGNMRFHVHRIHVLVFMKREWKPPDGLRAVSEGVVIAEGFVPEVDVHAGKSPRGRA